MAMHFFLGANSARGFVSLYPRLQEEGRRMYVLKGGPGCGKATCIRALCGRLGEAREFIHCCSDPDSLDGAVLEGCAIVDGTAPHVQEPLFPGSDGDYLTLPPFVDREGLARKADALYALKAASKSHYAGAYRLLAAAQKAREERESMGAALLTGPGPSRRAAGLLQREVPRKQGPGRERVRFMEGIGPKGFVCLTGTAERCPRVVALKDSFGLGGKLLEALREGALERGQTVYACMDPLEPERLRHVLLPDCGLAFVTDDGRFAPKASRTIRVDAMLPAEGLRQVRAKVRLLAKVEGELLDEAVEHIAAAHALHDRMEALYRPHIDVGAMEAWYDGLLARMEG
jgi:hypothetical protein